MKIDEKVFEKAVKDGAKTWRETSNWTRASFARHVLTAYLAEIEKPICIKKIKKNTMIIRGEK